MRTSDQTQAYGSPTREVYLLENVKIQGRKVELRQLLKLLNLAKNGQPKAALVTGDPGIGKTALLEAFTELVREGVYCRILDLGRFRFNSPEALYVAFIEGLQKEADAILDEALAAVNEITQELGLHWERQDLVRAIALVKLQESIGGKEAVSQEQLFKAIRSSVPTVKKLKFSVNENIEKLVDLIVNPWVMVATSMLNPMNPKLQEAIQLASHLKSSGSREFSGAEQAEMTAHAQDMQASLAQIAPQLNGAQSVTTTVTTNGVSGGEIVTLEQLSQDPSQTIVHIEQLKDGEYAQGDFMAPALVQPGMPMRRDADVMRSGRGGGTSPGPLVQHLANVLDFMNQTIGNIDSGLLVILDEWDRVLDLPDEDREAMKAFMSDLLQYATDQKNYHFMTLLAARNNGESYSLGGNLYNHFRTKLLLPALDENQARKLVRQPLKQVSAEIDEAVNRRIYGLSKGNPYWQLKIGRYLQERVESNRVHYVDDVFFEKLGVESLDDLLGLAFTRVKLAFLNDEASLFKVIAALAKVFGENTFSASQAIREISASQGFTEAYVFEVLRTLFRHDFLREVADPGDMPANRRGRVSLDPHYCIQSRDVFNFLTEKTRAIETDITTDEKLMYLKKIIPLSVKSGELDREKTMEVLSISEAMGNNDIVTFLEEVFLDHLNDEKPVVRVTALNNISLIDSDAAREAIFTGLKDKDSMVREYAARNLALLTHRAPEGNWARRIIEALYECIDDESEAVRTQVYTTLSKFRWQQDLTSVFIKGMSDACEAVRLASIRNLAETETDSPYLLDCLLDAADDAAPEIRKYACLGIQRYHTPETIETLVKVLQNDADSGIRALAADCLSHMGDDKAFDALVNALHREASEDVKMAVIRALGKRTGWQSEQILMDAVQNTNGEDMPAYLWAGIRSLGQVGGTERSLMVLRELEKRITNDILLSAIHIAIRKIQSRIDELRQLERQLEAATPMTVAVPSEYEEEVTLVEEEDLSAATTPATTNAE